VDLIKIILIRGKDAQEQINILGDDGVPISYHVDFWKSEVIDFIILQQDAFDPIDRNCPLERQRYMLNKVLDIYRMEFSFDEFEVINPYFKRIIDTLKQINYSEFQSEKFNNYEKELDKIIDERKIG
ncbi:MAG: V-type ATP synthase subunit A, partial [Bacteroidales bacterium]|nr:V-type ATP synthase subunit A [Bacteroidales bacterium]